MTCFCLVGCVESQQVENTGHFENRELDACLAIVVDLSGSFQSYWDDRAYTLFLQLSELYFTESMGSDAKLVICQLSGNDQVVLFEGQPDDLRNRFSGPEEFNEFLKAKSDPSSSKVFDATRRSVDYVRSITGVTENTKLLTVILSDMWDSEYDPVLRNTSREKLMQSLISYRQQGGGMALYFVAEEQMPEWQSIFNEAGFEPGHYIIENELVATPQLPQFD
ncbi:hypothetical protein [Thalassoglobus sp.]|uniref:hypothetical protein n=1 Tax=Thalassoglobus sp. TaxID=2795869 RepID=UPI003AA7F9A6